MGKGIRCSMGKLAARRKGCMGERAKATQLDAGLPPAPDLADVTQQRLKHVLHGLADMDFPLSSASFEAVVRSEVGLSEEQVTPGFSRYSDLLRPAYIARGFIKDQKDVPPGRKYVCKVPCGIAHPGVCRTRDADFFPALKDAAVALTAICCRESLPVGCFYSLKCYDTEGAEVFFATAFLCYIRKANPQCAVFAGCMEEFSHSVNCH